MRRDDIIAEARRWIGVPWRDKGRSRLGLDCIGLVDVVAASFGVRADYALDYDRRPTGLRLLSELRKYSVRVDPNGPLGGCVGIVTTETLPMHVGIFATLHGGLSFIHVIEARGCREDNCTLAANVWRLIEVRALRDMAI
jgi:hypothetical protein